MHIFVSLFDSSTYILGLENFRQEIKMYNFSRQCPVINSEMK